MNKRNFFLASAFSVILVLTCAARWHAQQEVDRQDAQAISQTGLLPVYGVDFAFDPAWVDGERFPSQSADFSNFGVNAAFQKVWDALKPSGFNAIRFPVDARDAQGAANRVANLCLWARKNNVKLVPILVGAERGRQLGVDFSANVSAFVNALLANLRGADGQGVQAYTQILFYQIENGMNHAGWHGAMAPQSSQLRILQVASALRRAEQERLKETGLNATPLIVNASFDYELIKARALAGATLDDRAYSQAYESLKQFLVEISASADIDVIGVEWFPGSVSAGGVEKVPALLRSLRTDLGAKQIIFATGCSTAFRSPEEQKKFYALAFTTLADYRASEGVDSPFIGVFFHEALNGKDSNPAPPTPILASEMKRWDWAAKSDEMARMWSGQGTSDALTWWLKKVENNMGLIGLESDLPNSLAVSAQPAQEGLQQIATIVSEANAAATDASEANATATDVSEANAAPTDASQANAAASESGVTSIPDPGATDSAEGSAADSSSDSTSAGFGAALKEKAQQGLMLLLDRLFEKFGNVISGIGSNTGGNPGESAPSAGAVPPIALMKEGVSFAPANPRVGEPVTFNIALSNQSLGADASGLVVALVDSSGVLSQVTDVVAPRNSKQNVTASWTPATEGTYSISAQVFDATLTSQLAGVSLDPVSVSAAPVDKERGAEATVAAVATDAIGLEVASGVKASGTKVQIPLGLPQLRITNLANMTKAGASGSLIVSASNPYARPLSNLKLTLFVDGKMTQTKTLGAMLAKQSRSFRFEKLPSLTAGKREIKLMIESAGARRLQGSITTQLQVRSKGPIAITQSAPKRYAPATPVFLVRPVLPAAFKVGRLSVPMASNSKAKATDPRKPSASVGIDTTRAASATGTQVRLNERLGADTRRAAGPTGAGLVKPFKPDLSVTASDISYNPSSPKVGAELVFTITARNQGGAEAAGAKVICALFAGNQMVNRTEFSASVKAGQSYSVKWKVKAPSSGQLRLSVMTVATQDTDANNNSAFALISVRPSSSSILPVRANTPIVIGGSSRDQTPRTTPTPKPTPSPKPIRPVTPIGAGRPSGTPTPTPRPVRPITRVP